MSVLLILSTLFFYSCDDDDGIAEAEGSGTISMKLGDDPFPLDLVSRAQITVDRIEVRSEGEIEGDEEKYYIVLDEPRVYNLIDFRNGLTADLPDVVVPAGSYDQVRLRVTNAEIELTNGDVYDLTVPSGATSGLKVFFKPPLLVNPDVTYEVLLDVDLTKSFVVQGNPDTPAGINGFHFKPVVRVVNLSEAGSIYGTVSDDSAVMIENAHVWVEQDSVVASTYTEADGSYRIIGLPSGSYTVYADIDGYEQIYVDDVSVGANTDTEVNFALELIP